MKTLFLLLLLGLHPAQTQAPARDTAVVAVDTLTRGETTHQRFKGVEINGTEAEFMAELYANGFSDGAQPTSVGGWYNGLFAGYKVKAKVLTTPITKTVYGIRSQLEPKPRFEDAYLDFATFLGHLKGVYGKPVTEIQRFQDPYTKGDGYSIRALKEGKATFMAGWNTGPGSVVITITATQDGWACLAITYTDNQNIMKEEEERTQVIRRDL